MSKSVGCGGCTLCCKVMNVPEYDAPAGQWCAHCEPGVGCSIHSERKQVCRGFECFWLANQSGEVESSPELRPDRCGVVFVVTQGDKLVSYVDQDRPEADLAPNVRPFIEHAVLRGFKSVTCVAGQGIVEREFTDPGVKRQLKEKTDGVRNFLQ